MHVHRIHLLAVMIVLGLMLGACVPPAAPPPAAPPAPAGPKVAKELVVYAPHGPEITEPMVALFKQKYPDIKVDVITAGTGELMNRIRAEKDNPLGDLMWGGATELYEANAELFAPVELENDAATVVQDEKHIWHAADLLFQAIAVNTDLLSEEEYPKTFKELADPKWKEKGGLALANPRASGTGYSLVTAMVTLYGWDFMVELLKNATITEGSSAMFKMVRDGEVPVAFINEDLGLKWIQEGAPLKMIYPEDGVSNQVGACALIKGAKHPEAAKVFLNFILSKEAQELLSKEIKRRPARTDVAPPEGLAPTAELKLVRPDPLWVSQQKDQILDKFDEVRQRAGK